MTAKTLRSKTFTSSLSADPRAAFEWIAEAANLPRWYAPLSRAPSVRFIRDDRAMLLDLVVQLEGVELTIAIRVLPNGDGSEIVMTLVQPRGLADTAFIEQSRWAGSAVAVLDKKQSQTQPAETASIASVESEQPLIPPSGKKLFVGNLPYSWTEDQLKELFAAHGSLLSVAIPKLRGRHGRSKGYGFVEMSTEEEAQTTILKLHDSLAGERKIIVRLARAKESRPESATTTSAEAPGSDTAVAEPANQAPQARPRRGNPQGRGGPRRSAKPPRAPRAPSRSGPRSGSDRPRRETGISNSSGYEIYPRDSKGGFSSEPTPRSAADNPKPPVESSPYFDDNGDFENRGNRNPRPRRR